MTESFACSRLKARVARLNNTKLALDENRLMSPAGDNACDRYQRVLGLDPDNARAKQGLSAVAGRYVGLADRAIDEGDADQARTFVDRARRDEASHPRIAAIERRLSRERSHAPDASARSEGTRRSGSERGALDSVVLQVLSQGAHLLVL